MIDSAPLDDTKQIARVIHLHPALATLSEQTQERIASSSSLRKCRRGELVSIPEKRFAIVGSGLVKSSIFIERRCVEFIVALAGPGETIDLFRPKRATKHTVLTQTAVVVFVNGAALSTELPAATRGMLIECDAAKNRVIDRLVAAVHSTAEGRVAIALLDLYERYGDDREDGSAFVALKLTRTELGALAGVSPETAIRTLSAWARSGLVTNTEDGVLEIHNLGELQKIAGEL